MTIALVGAQHPAWSLVADVLSDRRPLAPVVAALTRDHDVGLRIVRALASGPDPRLAQFGA